MKYVKNIKKVIIAAALMCSAMFLVACGGGEAEYKVTVKDATGNPVGTNVIVEFYQGDEQVAMQKCDENGVAVRTLEKGNYTVKLQFTGGMEALSFDEEAGKLTSSKRETEIVLSNAVGEAVTLYADGNEVTAYGVSAGNTKVDLVAGERNYFLFTPVEAGTYEFTVADGADAAIGYYGAPHFVQSTCATEVVDNKFTFSISASMIGAGDTGTTVMVLGLDAAEGVESALLSIQRIGEPEWSVENLEWTVYEKTVEISKYTVPAGASFKQFDITASGYNLVLNENDGFYHLDSADGPLVLMYLAVDPPQKYLPCFKTILDRSGLAKYIMDENDEVVEKISYSECAFEYIECADDIYGLYPLTEDLKTIMVERGNYVGWWDTESPSFIFNTSTGAPVAGLNPDIAWLFMCCYME